MASLPFSAAAYSAWISRTITPRDQFGNYLGRGYESAIKVVDMKSDPPTDRKQTGTYVFMLRDVPPRTPIKVNVDGVVIGAR